MGSVKDSTQLLIYIFCDLIQDVEIFTCNGFPSHQLDG